MSGLTVITGRRARVRIDLNSRTRDGLVRAWLREASEAVSVGQPVVAFEPEDGVAADATVAKVDEELGLVYLGVAWDTLRDDRYRPDPSVSTVGFSSEADSPQGRSANLGVFQTYLETIDAGADDDWDPQIDTSPSWELIPS